MTDNAFADLIPNQTAGNGSNAFADLIPASQSNANIPPATHESQLFHSLGASNPNFPNVKQEQGFLPMETTYNPDMTVDSSRINWAQPFKNMATGIGDLLQGAETRSTDTTPEAVNAMMGLSMVPSALKPVGAATEMAAKKLGEMGENSGISMNAGLMGIPSAMEKFSPTLQQTPEISKINGYLKTTKTNAYTNAKNLGAVLTPYASDHVAITVPSEVESTLGIRLDPNDPTYSQTRSALSNLQNKSAMGLTTNDLEQTRQRLNDILNGSSSGGDRMAAVVAKKSLDNIYSQIEQNPGMLANNNPAAIQAFREAREANGVYQRHSDIANIISDARGNPQKIQNAFQKLVSSKKENDFNLYSPDEQKLIESIAYPNGTDTKLEGGGLAAKTMHGAGIAAKASAGALLGHEVGHPILGGVVGGAQGVYSALGDTAKAARILKGADDLLKSISSKAKPISPIQGSAPLPFNPNISPFNQYPIMGWQEDPEIAARSGK